MMKILLLSPLPPPAGGIATWTEVYCRYLESSGHSVRLINTAVVGKRVSRQGEKHMKDEIVRAAHIFSGMRKALAEEEYDCVHINTSCSKLGLLRDAVCMGMAKGQNVILHCHCNIEDQIGSNVLSKRLLFRVAKMANRVLVLNKKSYEYLRALGCDNVRIVPNFIEADAIAEEYTVRENIEKIIYVGHVRRTKGLFEILEAAGKLPETIFQIVGPVCEDLTGVSVPANVHMLGTKPKDEVLKLLGDADVFLFPSYTEGFSIALLEAMASGLPVIATDVGANRDMIDEYGGIMIAKADPEAVVQAVGQLKMADVRERMSAWNRNKVKSCYTTERVMTDLLHTVREDVQ